MAPVSEPLPTSNTRAQPMEIPFDILDYIFSFLKSDPGSLIACSNAHPSFSPIAEIHLYYYIVIQTAPGPRSRCGGYRLELSQLLELLSEAPQIAGHVRVLQIIFNDHYLDRDVYTYQQIARILLLLPSVKCIMLRSWYPISWQTALPQTLRMAVENSLRLPTMREIHIDTILTFPLSLLNKHANITCLSFSACPRMPDRPDDTYPPLQLKSLIAECHNEEHYDSIYTWAKPHITTLRSLQSKFKYSTDKMVLEFLDICSGTLNNLDLEVGAPYETCYYMKSGRVSDAHTPPEPLINLSSLPYLQYLTIRVLEYFDNDDDYQELYVSYLPTAAKILKTASSSLQYLTIQILVDNSHIWQIIDFSPLTMLAEASAPFHRIDFYAMAPLDQIYQRLACYEGLKKLIKQGILIIHAEQTRTTPF